MQLRVLTLIGSLIFSSHCFSDTQERFKPCGIELDYLSTQTGRPGEIFYLYGTFGKEQGEKIPRINKGSSHNLTIVKWTNNKIKVKVPEWLSPGNYRVGVYCNNPKSKSKGGSYSTYWYDFEIT